MANRVGVQASKKHCKSWPPSQNRGRKLHLMAARQNGNCSVGGEVASGSRIYFPLGVSIAIPQAERIRKKKSKEYVAYGVNLNFG